MTVRMIGPVGVQLSGAQSEQYFHTHGAVTVAAIPDPIRGLAKGVLRRGHVAGAHGNGWLAGMLVFQGRDGLYNFVALPDVVAGLSAMDAELAELLAESKRPFGGDWDPLAGFYDHVDLQARELMARLQLIDVRPWDDLPDLLGKLMLANAATLVQAITSAAGDVPGALGRALALEQYADTLTAITNALTGGRDTRRAWYIRRAVEHHSSVGRLRVFLTAMAEIEGPMLDVAEQLCRRVVLFPENRAAFRLLQQIGQAQEAGVPLDDFAVGQALDDLCRERALPVVARGLAGLTKLAPADQLIQLTAARSVLASQPENNSQRALWTALQHIVLSAWQVHQSDRPRADKLAAFVDASAQFRQLWIQRSHPDFPDVVPGSWMPDAPRWPA